MSDLLGRRVVDRDGANLGTVNDVVARRTDDGRYAMVGLIASHHSVAGRIGFGGSVRPPAPFGWLLRALRRHEHYVPHDRIADLGAETLRATVRADDLGREWREP